MKKNELQETLVSLYLRLNGYFTTGLIIHSEKSLEVNAEIDIIGVRFQNHNQEKREITSSKELQISNSKIDIIIAEVKGGKNKLQFNDSLRNNKDNIKDMLNWIGCFNLNSYIIDEFSKLIQTSVIQNSDDFKKIEIDNISIRPIIFAPDRLSPKLNQIRYISGQELINYCWECLRPNVKREFCSTDYKSINNWGVQYEKLIGYFKNPEINNVDSIKSLYKHFNIE